jgi:hypothetical protein
MTSERIFNRELRARCDDSLHEKLHDAAKRSLRSLSAEVVFRLKTSVAADEAALPQCERAA